MHFLAEEVKASSDHTACAEECLKLIEVALEAGDLFGDIGAICEQGDLLVEALWFDGLCQGKGLKAVLEFLKLFGGQERGARCDLLEVVLDGLEALLDICAQVFAFALAHQQERNEGGFQRFQQMLAQFFGVCGKRGGLKHTGKLQDFFCGQWGLVFVGGLGLKLCIQAAVMADQFEIEARLTEKIGIFSEADIDFGSTTRDGCLQALLEQVLGFIEKRRDADLDIVVAVVDTFDLDDQRCAVDAAFGATKSGHAVEWEG